MAQPTVATGTLPALYRGEDWRQPLVHKASPLPGAAAVDITGWTILATVKEALGDDETPILEVEATLTTPASGQYELLVAAADSAALEVGDFPIDVWRMDAGAKTVLYKGTLPVRQPVRTPS